MTGEGTLRIALVVGALITGLQVLPRHASAAATITIVNLDGPGEGFNDPSAPDAASTTGGNTGETLGRQRLLAFQFAANIWGALLDSPVEVRVEARFDPLTCTETSAILGQAGAVSVFRDFSGAPRQGTWYPVALASKLFGADLDPPNILNPNTNDIVALFNSSLGQTGCLTGRPWYFGLDQTPPPTRFDFVTVLLHELGHGLGFQTFVNLATGAKFLGFDDAYMVHLEDHSTGLLYPAMLNAQRVAASMNTGNLHWVGPRVVAKSTGLTAGRALPSGHVEMYAPNPQRPGSSVSHFSISLSPNEGMEPFYTGPNHSVGLAAWLLDDIGWNVLAPDVAAVWGKLRPGCDTPPGLCFVRGEFFVRNQGTEATGGTTAGIYHSSDNVFNADVDPLLVAVPIDALAPGQAQRRKLSVSLPAGVSNPANTFLFAVADDGNVVPENEENNNAAPFAFGPTP